MSNSNQQDLNSESEPFFTRYLEGHLCEDLSIEEMEAVKGGTIYKIRADDEDSGIFIPPISLDFDFPSFPKIPIPKPPKFPSI